MPAAGSVRRNRAGGRHRARAPVEDAASVPVGGGQVLPNLTCTVSGRSVRVRGMQSGVPDFPFERSRGEQLGLPGTPYRDGHSFPLFLQ